MYGPPIDPPDPDYSCDNCGGGGEDSVGPNWDGAIWCLDCLAEALEEDCGDVERAYAIAHEVVRTQLWGGASDE